MIRCFRGDYIRFEDENQKRKNNLIVFEILNRKLNHIQVIALNSEHLILATIVDDITEISGFHRYKPIKNNLSPFGIGGLSKLPTDSKEGMLEGIARAARIDYSSLATNFGKGLLEVDNDYVLLIDS